MTRKGGKELVWLSKVRLTLLAKLLLKAIKNMQLVMASQTETYERIMLLLFISHDRGACLTECLMEPH